MARATTDSLRPAVGSLRSWHCQTPWAPTIPPSSRTQQHHGSVGSGCPRWCVLDAEKLLTTSPDRYSLRRLPATTPCLGASSPHRWRYQPDLPDYSDADETPCPQNTPSEFFSMHFRLGWRPSPLPLSPDFRILTVLAALCPLAFIGCGGSSTSGWTPKGSPTSLLKRSAIRPASRQGKRIHPAGDRVGHHGCDHIMPYVNLEKTTRLAALVVTGAGQCY